MDKHHMSSFKHVLVLLKWCLLYYLHLTWSVLEHMDAHQGCWVGTNCLCVAFTKVLTSSFFVQNLVQSIQQCKSTWWKVYGTVFDIRFNTLCLLGITAVCMCGSRNWKRHKGEFDCLGWRFSELLNRVTPTLNVGDEFLPDVLLLIFWNCCGECYLMNI